MVVVVVVGARVVVVAGAEVIDVVVADVVGATVVVAWSSFSSRAAT